MKKSRNLCGIIAVLLCTALSLTGCPDKPDENEDNGLKTLTGIIMINPSTTVTTGRELTAVYSGSERVTYHRNGKHKRFRRGGANPDGKYRLAWRQRNYFLPVETGGADNMG